MRVLIADDQKGVGNNSRPRSFPNATMRSLKLSAPALTQSKPTTASPRRSANGIHAALNGATACRNILSSYPAANVILVSGVAGAEDLSHSGAIAILSKPIDLARLKIRFERFLFAGKQALETS